jgi:hypothetical protein
MLHFDLDQICVESSVDVRFLCDSLAGPLYAATAWLAMRWLQLSKPLDNVQKNISQACHILAASLWDLYHKFCNNWKLHFAKSSYLDYKKDFCKRFLG